MSALPKVVHVGRGGWIEIERRRYPIEHVEGGRFAITFPAGHGPRDRAALEALVKAEPDKWAIEERR